MAEDRASGISGVLRETRRGVRTGDGGVVPEVGGEEYPGAGRGVTAEPTWQRRQDT